MVPTGVSLPPYAIRVPTDRVSGTWRAAAVLMLVQGGLLILASVGSGWLLSRPGSMAAAAGRQVPSDLSDLQRLAGSISDYEWMRFAYAALFCLPFIALGVSTVLRLGGLVWPRVLAGLLFGGSAMAALIVGLLNFLLFEGYDQALLNAAGPFGMGGNLADTVADGWLLTPVTALFATALMLFTAPRATVPTLPPPLPHRGATPR